MVHVSTKASPEGGSLPPSSSAWVRQLLQNGCGEPRNARMPYRLMHHERPVLTISVPTMRICLAVPVPDGKLNTSIARQIVRRTTEAKSDSLCSQPTKRPLDPH